MITLYSVAFVFIVDSNILMNSIFQYIIKSHLKLYIYIVTNNNVFCPTLRPSSLFAAGKKQRGRHLGDLGGLT